MHEGLDYPIGVGMLTPRTSERGATAVEFAIVGSLLFMILFGIIQFGIAFNRTQGIQAGAREGARLAAFPDTTVAAIVTRVRNSVSIVDPLALASGCPADPATLANETGCVGIQRRETNGTLTTLTSAAAMPCSDKPGATVVVTVNFRALIAIPLWKSQTTTLKGQGEFACEA